MTCMISKVIEYMKMKRSCSFTRYNGCYMCVIGGDVCDWNA